MVKTLTNRVQIHCKHVLGEADYTRASTKSKEIRCFELDGAGVGFANDGYWGIGLKNQTSYGVSFKAKSGKNFTGTLQTKLESNGAAVYSASVDFKPARGLDMRIVVSTLS